MLMECKELLSVLGLMALRRKDVSRSVRSVPSV